MSLPITPTPVLYGADARRFLRRKKAAEQGRGPRPTQAPRPDFEKLKRIAFGPPKE